YRAGARIELPARGRIGVQEALGQTDGADVEAVVPLHAVRSPRDELGRAAAEVDDQRRLAEPASGRDAAERHQRLVVPGQQSRREAVRPLDLSQERLAVLGIANRARPDREHALCTEAL